MKTSKLIQLKKNFHYNIYVHVYILYIPILYNIFAILLYIILLLLNLLLLYNENTGYSMNLKIHKRGCYAQSPELVQCQKYCDSV